MSAFGSKLIRAYPIIAGEILTPVQRELMPFFKVLVSIPKKEREHSQWMFGNPVLFSDKPRTSNP